MLQVFRCFTKSVKYLPIYYKRVHFQAHFKQQNAVPTLSGYVKPFKTFGKSQERDRKSVHFVVLSFSTWNWSKSKTQLAPPTFLGTVWGYLGNQILVGQGGVMSRSYTPLWALWCSSGPFLPRWPDPLLEYHQSLKQRQPFAIVILC